MAAMSSVLSPPQLGESGKTQRRTNGTAVLDHQASTAISGNAKVTPKYRHVAAVHSRQRASCLSQDSEVSPSFLGFRNLMVIVLSKLPFARSGKEMLY